jgi:hypothetical protein
MWYGNEANKMLLGKCFQQKVLVRTRNRWEGGAILNLVLKNRLWRYALKLMCKMNYMVP